MIKGMKLLIRAFIDKYLCCHEWEIVHIVKYNTCDKVLLKCTKCGKLKRKIV